MRVSAAPGICGQGWGSGREEGRAAFPLLLLSQGSEHLAAIDAPNPLKERLPAVGPRAVTFDLRFQRPSPGVRHRCGH